jgi:sigma-B regulation protein RsbU (phosphoserine phosphatase)
MRQWKEMMTDQSIHILAVDDNRMGLLKLARTLEAGGYTVSKADGGRAAMNMLQSGTYDLVLLDILMPEVDGFQVLREMKDDAALRDLPVIVVSGLEDVESVDACLAAGADDFLSKPVDPDVLQDRIAKIFGKAAQ